MSLLVPVRIKVMSLDQEMLPSDREVICYICYRKFEIYLQSYEFESTFCHLSDKNMELGGEPISVGSTDYPMLFV